MEWLFSLALLPILLCGLMCVGGMALAALGLRRGASRRSGRGGSATGSAHEEPAEVISR